MPSYVGFEISRVVIVESLECTDVKTGFETANFVQSLDSVVKSGVSIEYFECDSAQGFINLIKHLTDEAVRTRNYPLLHVECHGDDFCLIFRDKSFITWTELSALLLTLNRATNFNLISVFSACYGAYFLSQLKPVDPCPCYAILAPTEEIFPDEIMGSFRDFYSELFKTNDAGSAMLMISKRILRKGVWLAQLAETWYENNVIKYVQQQCTNKETKVRTLKIFKELQASGYTPRMRIIKNGLIQGNRDNLIYSYFDRYFTVSDSPISSIRFQVIRSRIKERMEELRATGLYKI